MGKNILLILIGLVAFLTTPAIASDQHSWLVAKLQGQAWIAQKGTKPARVKRGMFLKPGQTLSTKSRTRLLLKRGNERIQVGANAILALPPARFLKPGQTMILHQSGTLDLVVNKRDVKHFTVQTPYLAAVVKGTQFRVKVNEGKTDVSVSRGKVGVSSPLSGQSSDISRGQSASLSFEKKAKPKLTVSGIGKKPTIKKIPIKKKVHPAFRAMIEVDGTKRELKSGSTNNVISRQEQAIRDAERESGSNRSRGSGSSGRKASRPDKHDRSRDAAYSPNNDISSNQPDHGSQHPGQNDDDPASSAPSAPGNEENPSTPADKPSNSDESDPNVGNDNSDDESSAGHGGGISVDISSDGISVTQTEDPGISVTVTDGNGNSHTWGN